MAKMNWGRARQRPLDRPQNTMDRAAARLLGPPPAKPRSQPRASQHDEITITDGMQADGSLRVFRFKSRAEYDEWQRDVPFKSRGG